MDIFILDLDKFPAKKLLEFANNTNIICLIKNELKRKQHIAGRYLLDYAMKNFYQIEKYQLDTDGEKPILVGVNINFSISHSKNIVGIAFADAPIGFDIEYNKTERDYAAIIERYQDVSDFLKLEKNEQREEFYKFWTRHEAQIKLNSDKSELFFLSENLNEEFTYSVASEKPIIIYNFVTVEK